MVTYATIRQESMIECGVYSTDTDSITLFDQYVQESIDDIIARCSSQDFMQMLEQIVTEADEAQYDLQSGAAEIIALKYVEESTRLQYIPQTELVIRGYNLEDTGKPWAYYDVVYQASTSKYTIGLYPTPDDEYTLYAVERRASKVNADSDPLILPQRFIPAMKSYIRMAFNLRDGSPERVGFYREQYERQVQKAVEARPLARRLVVGENNRSRYMGDDWVNFGDEFIR